MHPSRRLTAARCPGRRFWLAGLLTALLLAAAGAVLAEEEFLPPEQAFRVSAEAAGPDAVLVRWAVTDGYYLYQSKFRFASETPGLDLGSPGFPPAETKEDAWFGTMEIFRGQGAVRLPLTRAPGGGDELQLQVRYQGCADAGFCYPPQRQMFRVALPPAPAAAVLPPTTADAGSADARPADPAPADQSSADRSTQDSIHPVAGLRGLIAPRTGGARDGLPPVEEAFRLDAQVLGADRLRLVWDLAPGTYLYRDKIRLALEAADGAALGPVELPPGEIEPYGVLPDGTVGEVAVHRGRLELEVPLVRSGAGPVEATLVVRDQGCAERGACYPPQTRRLPLSFPAVAGAPGGRPAAAGSPAVAAPASMVAAGPADDGGSAPGVNPASAARDEPPAEPPAEQERIAAVLAGGSVWAVVGLFYGFGLLLAFTPCVFPMIPILAGIVAGHGVHLGTRRAFTLSLVYVLAMALTYTAAGVLAGLFGSNLQAVFQNPWIIGAFALVFVVLALSMFGLFHLQLPAGLHDRLAALSHRQQGGTLAGVAVMGVLSALIVGPCVAPPLFGALIYIGQTGDALLGGVALFAMSLGMGTPLVAIGTSAGRLLPRSGAWMGTVNAVFGVGLLAVAVLLLERILPAALAMALWGFLLIGCAVYLGALTQLPESAGGWSRLWKGLGFGLLVYGSLMLVGAAAGGKDSLQPLRGLVGGPLGVAPDESAAGAPAFRRIKTTDDLDREVAAARAAGRPVMLDFYADWCVSCKELERETFTDPAVRAELGRFVLLQADVTDYDAADRALMQGRFQIPGPPAMLFFSPAGSELKDRRLVGFTPPGAFAEHLRRVHPPR